MSCTETKNLLNAYVDGELDSAGSLSVERHLQQCTSCLADVERLRTLTSAIQGSGLRFNAPPRLKRSVKAAIHRANPTRTTLFPVWRWATALASSALVLILGWAAVTQWTMSTEEMLVNDIVSSHVRSMMASHITDVASSDSHTVKPWFGGKLDYSPPAKDLTEQGFRLVGGRLDYIGNRPVASVVYQRSQHFINLFVWPSNATATRREEQLMRRGYNLIHWTRAGMTYWLVSELNATELGECARLLKE
jgi:anti-sigma factor RsiW